MIKRLTTILLLCAITISLTDCKKKNKDDDTPEPVVVEEKPNFTVIGNKYINSPIRFSSNLKQKKSIQWIFGDGTTETVMGVETTHSYAQPGAYQVTMAIDSGRGGAATNSIVVTLGTQKLGGNRQWNFLLKRYKFGYPNDHIPPEAYSQDFVLEISGDSIINIPSIQRMRYKGPHTVKLVDVTTEHMIFKSADGLTELSYNYANLRGGMKMTQVSKDTTWRLDGFADIF